MAGEEHPHLRIPAVIQRFFREAVLPLIAGIEQDLRQVCELLIGVCRQCLAFILFQGKPVIPYRFPGRCICKKIRKKAFGLSRLCSFDRGNDVIIRNSGNIRDLKNDPDKVRQRRGIDSFLIFNVRQVILYAPACRPMSLRLRENPRRLFPF